MLSDTKDPKSKTRRTRPYGPLGACRQVIRHGGPLCGTKLPFIALHETADVELKQPFTLRKNFVYLTLYVYGSVRFRM